MYHPYNLLFSVGSQLVPDSVDDVDGQDAAMSNYRCSISPVMILMSVLTIIIGISFFYYWKPVVGIYYIIAYTDQYQLVVTNL